MQVGAGSVDVDAVEDVLGASGEAEADTGREELGERVEAQHVAALREHLGLELKVGRDELLREVVCVSAARGRDADVTRYAQYGSSAVSHCPSACSARRALRSAPTHPPSSAGRTSSSR